MVRAQLLDCGKDAKFWCCAANCATESYNSILYLATNEQPHYSWHRDNSWDTHKQEVSLDGMILQQKKSN
eukprot:1768213-Ditylum_brightwellii.AAC.1